MAFGGFVDATLLRFGSARSAWLVGGRIAGDVRREERARTRFDTVSRETTGALSANARAISA
ncbi:MAG: hypothetical protein KY463_11790 [Actinobacteria bacterium]|nr:hypothetical protein [Actinomycetota bacterium]